MTFPAFGLVSAVSLSARSASAARRFALLVAACTIWLFSTHPASARSGGIASEGCTGCHSGGKVPTVTITPDLMTVNPGSVVNLTISISPTNGIGAGFYLEASSGKFSITDSGTHLLGDGVAQSSTRTVSSGNITFKVGWTAPSAPGNVDFSVWGNSVNADRGTGGDADGFGFYSTTFGCSGTKYYHDYDDDGFGVESSGYTIACSKPQYYALKAGDCNDNDPNIFPGAAEICDGRDNNCDGQVDEGLPSIAYCTDADGDGHGVLGKQTKMGCGPSMGFGLCDNDCDDNDPAVHPGAVEVCNNKDDNCNDRVDEGVRVVCGVGWCAKYADGCSTNCTPGPPKVEECNDFDDDCDGVKDNGTDLQLCGKPGLHCVAGACLTSGGAASGGATSGGAASQPASAGGAPAPAGGNGGSVSDPSLSDSPSSCGFSGTRASSVSASSTVLILLLVMRRRKKTKKFGPC